MVVYSVKHFSKSLALDVRFMMQMSSIFDSFYLVMNFALNSTTIVATVLPLSVSSFFYNRAQRKERTATC